MVCTHGDCLLLVLLVLLLNHVKLPVSSYQDEHLRSFTWPDRLRHHHVPERYLEKQQMPARISLHTSLMKTTSTPWRPAWKQYKNAGLANHKVDKAAHVFRTSSATVQPPYNKLVVAKDRRQHQPDKGLGQWHYKDGHWPAKLSFSSATSRVRGKSTDGTMDRYYTIKDNDYYYYDEDDGDYAPAVSEAEEGEDVDENNAPWHRTTASPKREEELKQQPVAMIDDYTFDYLDDEPLNSADSDDKTGSLTEEKWRNYGTAEAVENSRRRHMSEAQNVSAHITRIHLEAMCKHPRPKIIQINDASKRYVPHCTVLHRCGDDTGCCHSEIQTCVAKKTAAVDLYFYVIPFGNKDPVVETLSFINHTECHCVDRHRFRSFSSPVGNTTGGADNRACHCVRNFNVFEGDLPGDENSDQRSRQGDCRCDCLSENQTCLRLKRGQEGFSVEDRRCISDGRCTPPNCQYGEYSTRVGRCPRSQSKRMTPYPRMFD